MYYIPNTLDAFWSIDYIMREVNYGWLFRYVHANGASFFFFAVYAHILRTVFAGSYISKRKTWASGILIFFLIMLTAFLGYVLPWGQMSYWAATVITSLVSIIPLGDWILIYILGGFTVSQAALGRMFALHFLLPFIILALVAIHLLILHIEGSSDAWGVFNQNDDTSFHPLFSIKDICGLIGILICFNYILFFLPQSLGHPINYQEADPEVTPAHIVPEWYFLIYYGILRAIPHKGLGIAITALAVIFFFVLPWLLNKTQIRDSYFRESHKIWVALIIYTLILIGWFGACIPETPFIEGALICTIFFFFLLFLKSIVF